jgi:hypothetical protein
VDKSQLKQAIESLKEKHALGKVIKGKLRRKPNGKNYLKGEYDYVARELKLKISGPMARRMVEFSERYTEDQLNALVAKCRLHEHAPTFDVVIKLLPVQPLTVRNQLQLLTIKNRWRKERLAQTIRAWKATAAFARREDGVQDVRFQGRQPRATKSYEALLGELRDSEIKWRHISFVLEKQKESGAEDTVWASMCPEMRREFKKLVKLFFKLSRCCGAVD